MAEQSTFAMMDELHAAVERIQHADLMRMLDTPYWHEVTRTLAFIGANWPYTVENLQSDFTSEAQADE